MDAKFFVLRLVNCSRHLQFFRVTFSSSGGKGEDVLSWEGVGIRVGHEENVSNWKHPTRPGKLAIKTAFDYRAGALDCLRFGLNSPLDLHFSTPEQIVAEDAWQSDI